MKIYGPFHALNNPFVMANLASGVLANAVDAYNTVNQQQSADFLKASLVADQPVESMPGGPIRRGLSKITGGFVDPNVHPTGSQYADEVLGVRQQDVAKREQERKDQALNLQTMGLQDRLRHEGVEEQQGERKIQATEAAQKATQAYHEKLTSPGFLGMKAGIDAGARVAAEGTPTALNILDQREAIKAKYKNPPKTKEEIAAEAAARTHATNVQNQIDTDNMPLADTQTNKKVGGAYIDMTTGQIVTGQDPSGPKTKKDADNMPERYRFVSNKNLQSVKDTFNEVHRIDKFIKAIDEGKADNFLPDETKHSKLYLPKVRADYGTANYMQRGSDPDRVPWYGLYGDLIRFYTSLQHRYPSRPELQNALVPDLGGLIPDQGLEKGVLHLGGLNPLRMADTKQAARAKLVQLKEQLLGDMSTASGEDITSMGDGTDFDVMKFSPKTGAK